MFSDDHQVPGLNGIILLHDCLPDNVFTQAIPRCKKNWHGDVWKSIVEFRTKEEFDTYTCYADQGIGIILKRKNRKKLEIKIKDFSKLKFLDFYGNYNNYMNIIEYDEIIIHYDSIKHVSCYNGNDGYISVSNSGGVTPYSYLWIPTNETTNQISDLYAVPHIIKVTDSVNCIVVDTIDLYELTEPIQTISSVVNIVSCFEGYDGEISASTIGGMPNYTYVWINENLDTVSTNEIDAVPKLSVTLHVASL